MSKLQWRATRHLAPPARTIHPPGTPDAPPPGVMLEERPDSFDSTLVRRGSAALSLSEMESFVETIQKRSLDKLLGDLPGLAALSETKFGLARQVLRRRVRSLAQPDYEQLRVLALEVADGASVIVGARIRSLFAE